MIGTGSKRQRGFSIVEILVTIVIFTVGILAVIQIFPQGLGVLRTSRNNTMAQSMVKAELERIKTNSDQLPEAILAANYNWVGGQWVIVSDINRSPNDLTPQATGLSQTGILSDTAGPLGNWTRFSGSNTFRRIVGEGRTIPGPRFIPTSTGQFFGCELTLQFAPVLFDPSFQDSLLIYGNDLAKAWVEDVPAGQRMRRDYIAFIDNDGLNMALPEGPYRADNPTLERRYRISAAVRYNNGGGTVRQVVVGKVVTIPQAAAGQPRTYVGVDLATEFAQPGLTFDYVEPDTVQVQRIFEVTGTFLTDTDVRNNGQLQDDAAYQCRVLDPTLGVIVFNPLGANYREQRPNGRVPLAARVDYDVLDWRNIKDDFRVPNQGPYQQKLLLDSIKNKGGQNIDSLKYTGLGFNVNAGNGTTQERDLIIVDRETGGVFSPDSYNVDMLLGLIRFVDFDGNPANGLTAHIVYSDNGAPSTIADIRGRSVRAIYEGSNDFAVQVQKPTSYYRPTTSASIGYGQCYLGTTDQFTSGDLPTRIYFPRSDVGKKVVVGDVWYQYADASVHQMQEQEYRIQPPTPAFPLGYIDIRDKDPNATTIDYASNGYGVRYVRGASVTVNVLWNPGYFRLGTDPAENMNILGTWLGGMRRSSSESFIMRGESQ